MPIKWTPEVDQILLLKILETSQVNADVKAISAAWPDGFEKPTPRAITERLVKIRASSKASGAASHFSVSNARGNGTPSPAATPKKPRTPAKAGGSAKGTPSKLGTSVNGAAGGKRKRSNDDDPSDNAESVKAENNDSNAFDCNNSPSRKTAKGPSRVKVEHAEEDDNELQGSGYENTATPYGVEDLEEGTYA